MFWVTFTVRPLKNTFCIVILFKIAFFLSIYVFWVTFTVCPLKNTFCIVILFKIAFFLSIYVFWVTFTVCPLKNTFCIVILFKIAFFLSIYVFWVTFTVCPLKNRCSTSIRRGMQEKKSATMKVKPTWIQRHKRFQRTLFLQAKHNMQIFWVIPIIKLQTDT